MFEFKLPSLGADMDEGTLLEWKVAPGEAVHKGQVVAVVDTAKAAVDVEIWSPGTIHELLVEPGQTIPVGTVLATLLAPGETAPPPAVSAPEPAAAPAAVPVAALQPPAAAGERRRVSPAARKHAEELGIDLAAVLGSGPGGTVTLSDVEQAAAVRAWGGKALAAEPGAGSAPPTDRQAEMRKAIAAAMSRSKREIPHYYLSESIAMARARDWLLQANAGRPIGERLLMAALQLKAVALALKEYPEMNGFYRNGSFEPAGAAHIGVAIALRQGGLIAPAIHDVGDKTLEQVMRDLGDLVRRVRAGSLKSSEMSDPTITVTNLGEQGVEAVHGVIYPPQVALVGLGRIGLRPWIEDDALCVQPVVTATLAADHRVSDGHRGALFLAELRERLQQPESL
ncbi:dihydrolipoamide acetyltransferase family protein [Rhodocyclus purpureus]|uniref:dihydrolipoamide acetyltransferase family protein n=1 Tax=Rhodocyclus purpureus TaxID=1067 RepID=UPI00191424B6|nr:dihydrolipoamide acetyltransferase family protein [Rhodocyclus purpureus]MBK5915401.1 branched-chain alpha-keto acid dehydrogenase subunit E2 [Rhodocyclus purpureus]